MAVVVEQRNIRNQQQASTNYGNLTADQIFLNNPPTKARLFEPKYFPILNRNTNTLHTPGREFKPFVEKLNKEIEEKIARVHEFVELSRKKTTIGQRIKIGNEFSLPLGIGYLSQRQAPSEQTKVN